MARTAAPVALRVDCVFRGYGAPALRYPNAPGDFGLCAHDLRLDADLPCQDDCDGLQYQLGLGPRDRAPRVCRTDAGFNFAGS